MPAKRKEYPEAESLYLKGMSIQDVAEFYGVTRQSMHKWMTRRNVPLRSNIRFGKENVFYRGGVTQDDRARTIYQTAIKRGRLVNPKVCSVCGDNTHVSGHHDDYSKPLDVKWLCHACHYTWHQTHTAKQAVGLPRKLTRQEICSMGGKASRKNQKQL